LFTTPRVIKEAVVAIALVTGTSSGIGLATAVTLARAGHKVIATMRNVDGAGELQKIILAEGLPITVAALNVDDDGSVSDAVDRALVENGRIDVLVNNAGVVAEDRWRRCRWKCSAKSWRQIFLAGSAASKQ
jgi:NAD(P)-dependent dehydrogenase (short-subunit alcohol dehydrogenase family)